MHNGMSALYAENGIEYAVDDVRGLFLTPPWYMLAVQQRWNSSTA